MGLDITAASRLVLVGPPPGPDEYEWETHIRVSDNKAIMRRGIEPGLYRVDGERIGFRAGSYSGYNHWREILCEATMGVEPKVVWNDPDRFAGKPFVGLVNFSDCEGYIGGHEAMALLRDFEAQREKVLAFFRKKEMHQDWLDKYEDWAKGFALAADSGVVWFH